MASTSPTTPRILLCACPAPGHVMPLKAIGKVLLDHGYLVSFLTGADFKTAVESSGLEFLPLPPTADFSMSEMATRFAPRFAIPPGPLQFAWDLEHLFVAFSEFQFMAIKEIMTKYEKEEPERPVIVIAETAFWGVLPILLNAPCPKPAGIIGVGIAPLWSSSIDCAPFGPGLPPDNSPEGRVRNIAMNKQTHEMFEGPQSAFQKILAKFGAQPSPYFVIDASVQLPDIFLQLCTPSLEYPRSDNPQGLRFIGPINQRKNVGGVTPPDAPLPEWWSDLTTAKASGKRIVVVVQGTVSLDYTNLIVPTLNALKDETDILVVTTLGTKGAKLPDGTVVPSNARVTDYVDYDGLLAIADCLVTNGGYGGVQQALTYGLPIVAAGAGEDKPEVAARVAWAGLGVNLATRTPSEAQIKEGILQIFNDSSFAEKARQMRKEIDETNTFGIVVQEVETLVKKHGFKSRDELITAHKSGIEVSSKGITQDIA